MLHGALHELMPKNNANALHDQMKLFYLVLCQVQQVEDRHKSQHERKKKERQPQNSIVFHEHNAKLIFDEFLRRHYLNLIQKEFQAQGNNYEQIV